MNKKKFQLPSSYTILIALIVIVAALTLVIPEVTNATLSDVFMAPSRGLAGAIDISLFILMIGGFLGVVTETGALDAGIAVIVKKMKGKEIMLIPILMILFSLGGTTYGMAEETIAFYALIVSTMIAAKMDSLVGVATVLLGAGTGVLGSTVNPFAVGAAIDAIQAANPEIKINQSIILGLGTILWFTSLAIAMFFVVSYAKKVKADPSKSLLTREEKDASISEFANKSIGEEVKMTGRMYLALGIFVFAFIIMVISLIPWESFGITIFAGTSALTGVALGGWYFQELQSWFLFMAIVVAICFGLKEKRLVKSFIAGAADMVGVALIVGISRGISVLLSSTGFDQYILDNASNMLNGIAGAIFAGVAYIIYILLSFLIPSTSGLAAASMPTFGGLTNSLGLSPEVMIMIFSAGSGIVNLVTPTSGAVMGGLAIAKVEYSTWLKFVGKVIACIFVANFIILSIAMTVIK